MRRSLAALVVASALALAACGDDGDGGGSASPPANGAESPSPPTGGDKPQAEATEATDGAGGFTGQAAETYREGKTICGLFPPDKVARDLGVTADTSTSEGIVSIAEAYAEGFVGSLSQPAFEGCLDGLPNP